MKRNGTLLSNLKWHLCTENKDGKFSALLNLPVLADSSGSTEVIQDLVPTKANKERGADDSHDNFGNSSPHVFYPDEGRNQTDTFFLSDSTHEIFIYLPKNWSNMNPHKWIPAIELDK